MNLKRPAIGSAPVDGGADREPSAVRGRDRHRRDGHPHGDRRDRRPGRAPHARAAPAGRAPRQGHVHQGPHPAVHDPGVRGHPARDSGGSWRNTASPTRSRSARWRPARCARRRTATPSCDRIYIATRHQRARDRRGRGEPPDVPGRAGRRWRGSPNWPRATCWSSERGRRQHGTAARAAGPRGVLQLLPPRLAAHARDAASTTAAPTERVRTILGQHIQPHGGADAAADVPRRTVAGPGGHVRRRAHSPPPSSARTGPTHHAARARTSRPSPPSRTRSSRSPWPGWSSKYQLTYQEAETVGPALLVYVHLARAFKAEKHRRAEDQPSATACCRR